MKPSRATSNIEISFGRDLSQFIHDRTFDLSAKLFRIPAYSKAKNKAIDLEVKMCRLAKREGFNEYAEFENANALAYGIMLDETYLQGLRDGLTLAKLLSGTALEEIAKLEHSPKEDAECK
ncbi:MAG: hypothetical protein FH749_07965 [Firmicutes bacterium]|nr:hypothetical protein [Bacillota bacterium]